MKNFFFIRINTFFRSILVGIFFALPAFSSGNSISVIDFGNVKTNDTEKWLKSNGYEFEFNTEEMNPKFENGRLNIVPDQDVFGLMILRIDIPEAKRVRIYWGANAFHEEGDYSKEIRREVISVAISFGKETLPSGSIFIPDVPYFINIVFGRYEDPEKQYLGSYHKQGGRVICPSCGLAEPNKEIVTEVDLERQFAKGFPGVPMPAVSSISIATDTRDSNFRYRAFIRKIEFLD